MTPNEPPRIRPYQREANTNVEQAIRERKRRMLIAMATGTGKTFTMVNQIYRLMKSGVAKRVLFLVDRRSLAAQAVRAFAAHIPDGDLAAYATALPKKIRDDFTPTMKLLRDPAFQKLLVSYPRPRPDFLVAYGVVDAVSSTYFVRSAVGEEYRAEDYLDAFVRYVHENQDRIAAIRMLLDRPKSWSPAALTELKRGLLATAEQFTEPRRQSATAYRVRTPSLHFPKQERPALT